MVHGETFHFKCTLVLSIVGYWNKLLKLINNSSSFNKGNHDCDGVWISYLNLHWILAFYYSVYFLVLVLIEKICQTLKTVFDHISKDLKLCQKYSAARRIFNSLLVVWKCGQTRSFVFDMLYVTGNLILSAKWLFLLLSSRFLCDYTYYKSLHLGQGRGTVAFVHVPRVDSPYSIEELVVSLRLIILAMLKQLN